MPSWATFVVMSSWVVSVMLPVSASTAPSIVVSLAVPPVDVTVAVTSTDAGLAAAVFSGVAATTDSRRGVGTAAAVVVACAAREGEDGRSGQECAEHQYFRSCGCHLVIRTGAQSSDGPPSRQVTSVWRM